VIFDEMKQMQQLGAVTAASEVKDAGVSPTAVPPPPPPLPHTLPLGQLVGPGSQRGRNRLAAARLFSDLLVLNSTGFVRLVQEQQQELGGLEENVASIFIRPTAKLIAGSETSMTI
ncbi:hypothetical protein Vafri_326, partial [Volvox africanus]